MREHFKRQIESAIPLSAERAALMSSLTLFNGHWQEGDRMLFSMIKNELETKIVSLCERDFKMLENEYDFISTHVLGYPIFVRKHV